MTVFADLAFLVGSAFCGIVLHLASVSLDLRKSLWRCAVAALCGGVLSALFLTVPVPSWCIALGGAVTVSVLFWGKTLPGTIRNAFRVFVVALLYLGLVFVISAAIFGLSVFFGGEGGYFILSFPATVLAGGIAYAVCLQFLRKLQKIKRQPPLCECTVEIRGKRIFFRAYMDSGNFLSDPVNGRPVAVVEYRTLKKGFGKDLPAFGSYDFYAFFGEKARIVPYRSISGDGRMLPAFIPDTFTVNGQGRTAVVAVSDRVLEAQGRFSGIIGPDLIGGIEDENR